MHNLPSLDLKSTISAKSVEVIFTSCFSTIKYKLALLKIKKIINYLNCSPMSKTSILLLFIKKTN